MLVFKSVSSNNKEEWSQALTSCRPLVIADILEYLDEDKPLKLDINKASLDELEVHLDVSHTIAKEIFKTRAKEGYLDIDILTNIKGVGRKTLEQAKIVFIIDE